MILVKIKTGPSPIAGTGVFAYELITKDTVVWKFDSKIDSILPETDSSLHYAYQSRQTDRIIMPGDSAKYINHSDTPNLGTRYEAGIEEDINFALRDIEIGEELTINYNTFAKEGVDFI